MVVIICGKYGNNRSRIEKVTERTRFSKSRSNDLVDIGQGQRSSYATHLLMLVIICTKYGKNPSRTVDATERTQFSRSRPNDLENIGQGQRSLHATHPLMLMMICAKYGKNASRIVPFHKSQDALLHPGVKDQIQNTLFTEDPHFGIGLIDCQDQRAPTLIGQRWSTISASTLYPRLNPLWLVTHCTLSQAHHSFQSHMYHLACMEMSKFLCSIFNWLKLFYCNGVTSPKPLS